jgi:hypothetical protein
MAFGAVEACAGSAGEASFIARTPLPLLLAPSLLMIVLPELPTNVPPFGLIRSSRRY